MPIALDPRKTWEYEFKDDSGAALVFRYVTSTQAADIAELIEKADAETSLRSKAKAYGDAIRASLCDWRDMPDPSTGKPMDFDPSRIESVLTLAEIAAVLEAVFSRIQLGDTDQKKSESPSPSNEEKSAEGATAESA
jgi:hypothetical protein